MNKSIAIFSLLFLVSCSDIDDKESAMTTSTDGIHYTNEKFNMRIVKPESWHAQSVAELIATQQMGARVMSGDDENFEAMVEASLASSLPLFGFHEFAPGTPTTVNSSITGVAENIAVMPGIKSGCDYLYHAKQALRQSQVDIDINDECLTEVVNGTKLSYFSTTMRFGPNTAKQKLFACLSGDYAIAIVHTLVNKDNTEEVDAILNSLTIDCEA